MTSASTKRRHKQSVDTERRMSVGKDAEIQRLRAAMVHAMDEAETGARANTSWEARRALEAVAKDLKTALEKK